MIATGEGELDMVKERIDLTITPMSKSRAIQVPSSVRIRGPLDNVTPIISPVKAVMNVSAEALTLIPRLTMKMFGVRPSNRKNQPCEP
jgi:spore maturation protein SpmB